jgi:hypothetical protein
MPTIADTYIGQIYDKAGFFAPWLPNTRMELGAVGVLEDGIFVARSTLAEEGIPWKASELGNPAPFKLVSERGVDVRMKAEAELIPASVLKVGEAGALISFTKRGATVVHASGVREQRIASGEAVGRTVLEAFEKKKWKKQWVFVDQVYVAESATILVSEGTEVKVELRAKTSALAASTVPFAAGFELASSSGSYFEMIGQGEMTVMFHLSRVTQSWVDSLVGGKPVLGGAKRAAPRPEALAPRPAAGDPVLEPVPYAPDLSLLDE